MLVLHGDPKACRGFAVKPHLRLAGMTCSRTTAQAAEDAADNVEARFNAGFVTRFAVEAAFKQHTTHLRMASAFQSVPPAAWGTAMPSGTQDLGSGPQQVQASLTCFQTLLFFAEPSGSCPVAKSKL